MPMNIHAKQKSKSYHLCENYVSKMSMYRCYLLSSIIIYDYYTEYFVFSHKIVFLEFSSTFMRASMVPSLIRLA